MKPNSKWINDWQIGVKPSKEQEIGESILNIFMEFWDDQKLDDKSKSTRNRYAGSLKALGGYLVEQAVSNTDVYKTPGDLLSGNLSPYDGPLIFHDNENWQEEVDLVCRKLYKYMSKKC